MIPALVLGQCPTGSAPTTPPTLAGLPGTVNVTAVAGTVTAYSATLSASTSSTLSNIAYNAWCTYQTSGSGPGGKTGGTAYTAYSSYSYGTAFTSTTFGPSSNTGGLLPNPYSLAQEWSLINFLINDITYNSSTKTYTSTAFGTTSLTVADIQGVIWQILDNYNGNNNVGSTTFGADGTNSLAYFDKLVASAAALNFIPSNGQLIAVVLVPQNLNNDDEQGLFVTVPVNSNNGCTGTSNLELVRGQSVTSANPFQAVTYGWAVINAGSTTLTNVTVTDDNGTPNYTGDDYTVVSGLTLTPGQSQTFFKTVYLPITLFAQAGNEAIFDTLIPQVVSSTDWQVSYLIDTDVMDNTYGTSASAGWTPVGGHQLWQDLQGNYAEYQFIDAGNHDVLDFNADFLTFNGSSFYSTGLHGGIIAGSSSYIESITSTLAQDLSGIPAGSPATVNSPTTSTWQADSAYIANINPSVFNADKCGAGVGAIKINKNYIAYSKLGANLCYSPYAIGAKITDTAFATATVCGCNTVIHTQASICITLNGCAIPTGCNNLSLHKCEHQVECVCPCANCQAGKHNQCTQSNCTDVRCTDQGCPQHNVTGICNPGSAPSNGGLDGAGYCYPSLGSKITWSGCNFNLPVPGSANCASGKTLPLPSGKYSTLKCLATAVNGAQYNQTFVVTYTDGSTDTFTQNLSDWCKPSNYSGESVVVNTGYRCTPNGGTQSSPTGINLYGYSFPLNSSKAVQCVTLPNNRNVIVASVNCK